MITGKPKSTGRINGGGSFNKEQGEISLLNECGMITSPKGFERKFFGSSENLRVDPDTSPVGAVLDSARNGSFSRENGILGSSSGMKSVSFSTGTNWFGAKLSSANASFSRSIGKSKSPVGGGISEVKSSSS